MSKERERTAGKPSESVNELKYLSSFKLFLFVTLAIAILAGCGYLMNYAQQQKTQQIVEQGLDSIALADSAQVSSWRTGKLQDAVFWMNNQSFKEEFSQYLSSPDGRQTEIPYPGRIRPADQEIHLQRYCIARCQQYGSPEPEQFKRTPSGGIENPDIDHR